MGGMALLMKKIVWGLLLLFVQTHAQEAGAEAALLADRLVAMALTNQTGYSWLRELCSIPPGGGGSPDFFRSVAWAENKFREIGCDTIWRQPVTVPGWSRGKIGTARISQSVRHKGKSLAVAALFPSVGTDPRGLRARVLEVRSTAELAEKGALANGKIVFFNRPFDQSQLNTFSGYGQAVDQRINGAAEAARYGAAGALVRSVTSRNDNVPHVGMMKYQEGLPHLPAAAIGLKDADFLSRALAAEPDLQIELNLSCQSQSPVESCNLIGQINGSDKSDEIIVIGGHWDAWDQGDAAHDDRGPCLQTMEALYLLLQAGIQPRRTLRCVLFTNEETGLQGAVAYAKAAETRGETHYAAIESDRGAFTPRGFNVTTDSLTLLRLQAWLPLLHKSGIEWIRAGGSGGDIAQIRNTQALFGYVPDSQRYMDLHHSANDLFGEVHPREMELGSSAIAILTYLLSEAEL